MSGRQVAETISWICGWAYFVLWSAAVYPQPILNFQRRSTEGLTFDFPLLNVLGAACFTLSCALLLFSPTIRSEYAVRYPASPEPTVRANDVCVGANAVILDSIVVSQFWPSIWRWNSKVSPNRQAGKITLGVISGCVLAIITCVAVVVFAPSTGWESIDVVYALVYVKLWTVVFKYTPHAVSNFRRKSTLGWSIHYVHLDVGGGIFSLVQLLIDASLQPDWSGLTGNPLKLWLAGISITADAVFLIQHYIVYGAVEPRGFATDRYGHHGEAAPEEGIMLTSLDAAAADDDDEGSAIATPESQEEDESKPV
ncbi:hypothetical protein M409DRAFT_70166 [Zasmidium cellare ATCC 36951]|uniref:Cystinosin n=1 Tax=Zasmidium cellare ATCC 36951 TaxID=1080233 RepID=A0A6A6C654_ZASCE|nr:uncharacterized protein M409DRAFT_70166 [Zasmidium cellare ATCC 36951]KAF2160856.1 hypothetical protein M409DRAFT_70166 [Zasmidium cellare ATCC 36951]